MSYFSWEPSLDEKKREELRRTILEIGKKREPEGTHDLGKSEVRTVLTTCRFLVEDQGYLSLARFDLLDAMYPIYDWIGMLLDGRDAGNERLTQVMASAYLRSNDVRGFIRNLRRKDYQLEEPKLEPIEDGDGNVDLSLDDKLELLKNAKTGHSSEEETPIIEEGSDGIEWFSKVYGSWLPVSDVIGLCPACREPIVGDAMDQDLATSKDNYCGCCGYEAHDGELVKVPRNHPEI